VSRKETGMAGKTDGNPAPFRPRNQPLQNAGNEVLPKEPAARKQQLPSNGKEKLQSRAQPPRQPGLMLELRAARRSALQAGPAGGRWLRRRRWGQPRLRKALGPGVQRRPRAARAQRPRPHPSLPPQAVGGETRAKEKADNAGPGW
jgi:hypothetical protein